MTVKLPERLEFSLSFHANRLAQALRREQLQALKPYGLTPEQWQVLIVLWERDTVSQTELAELTGRDEPSVSRMVRTMETHGWVERKIDEVDGRTRRLCATAKAWDSRDALFVAFDARIRHLHDQMPPMLLEGLMQRVSACASALESIGAQEPVALPTVETTDTTAPAATAERESRADFSQFFNPKPQPNEPKKEDAAPRFATPFNWLQNS